MKKTALKCRAWTKNFARLEFFSHLNFSISRKQRYEQKPLSFRSAFHFCSAPKLLQIFSRVSFPASKINPTKLIQKRTFPILLFESQKDSAPIQFKFFELLKKQERYNSRLRRWGRLLKKVIMPNSKDKKTYSHLLWSHYQDHIKKRMN